MKVVFNVHFLHIHVLLRFAPSDPLEPQMSPDVLYILRVRNRTLTVALHAERERDLLLQSAGGMDGYFLH